MDRLESLLRQEFANPPAFGRPSISELITSTVRIRRRRRVVAGVATVVAVISIVLASVVVTGSHASVESSSRPQSTPSIDRSTIAALNSAFVARTGSVDAARFTDAQHGFLELRHCAGTLKNRTCTDEIEASDDGGVTFSQRTVPAGSFYSVLYVFDASRLVMDKYQLVGRNYLIQKRWVSSDGAVTWQSISPQPSGSASSIPPGAQLIPSEFADQIDSGDTTPEPNLLALSADGTSVRLPDAPGSVGVGGGEGFPSGIAGTYEHAGIYLTADHGANAHADGELGGRLWASRDQGATWTAAKLPAPVAVSGNDASSALAVLGGAAGRLFLIANQDGADSLVPPYLATSADSGLTWQKIATPVPFRTPDDEEGIAGYSAAVLPTGALVLSGQDRLWLLPPGSTTWQPIQDGLLTTEVWSLGGAVMAVRGTGTRLGLYVTTDGTHWRESTVR